MLTPWKKRIWQSCFGDKKPKNSKMTKLFVKLCVVFLKTLFTLKKKTVRNTTMCCFCLKTMVILTLGYLAKFLSNADYVISKAKHIVLTSVSTKSLFTTTLQRQKNGKQII